MFTTCAPDYQQITSSHRGMEGVPGVIDHFHPAKNITGSRCTKAGRAARAVSKGTEVTPLKQNQGKELFLRQAVLFMQSHRW